MHSQIRDLAEELQRNLDHALSTIAQRDSSAQNWAIFVWNHLELLRASRIPESSRSQLRPHADRWKKVTEEWGQSNYDLAGAITALNEEKPSLREALRKIVGQP